MDSTSAAIKQDLPFGYEDGVELLCSFLHGRMRGLDPPRHA